MAVAGEQILTRLGFEVDGISLKSSLEKAAAFGSALRRAFADASAAFVGVAKGEAEVAAQADALGVSVERFAEWPVHRGTDGRFGGRARSLPQGHARQQSGFVRRGLGTRARGRGYAGDGRCQREAYARGLGIDPSLIPMLTRDVSRCATCSGRSYATAGTDAGESRRGRQGLP